MAGAWLLIVAVDTLFMSNRFRQTGTGVYLSQLLSACLKACRESPDFEFHGFALPQDSWASNGFVSPHLRVHQARVLAHRPFWLMGGMAMHTARLKPDLVFIPTAHHSLPGPFAPVVTTIHDAMPKRLPLEVMRHSTALHLMTWANARAATKLITVSHWSKQDLIDIYHLDPGKIEVTYLGFNKLLYNAAPPDPEASAGLLDRLGVRRPFVIHHGMVQLRKNLHRLIQAWDRVRESCRDFDAQLVLAGPMGLGAEEILRVREASPNRNQIIVTGPLPETELATLIKNAALCVIPSLYEGFCLPMVEAMACGVPTVASNASCIPEVSGGVLEYFAPCSLEEMAHVMRRALENSGLREQLRQKGLGRAEEFSWERCGRQTLRIFADAAANYGRQYSRSSVL